MKPNFTFSIVCIAVLLFCFVACISKMPTANEPPDTQALTANQKEIPGTTATAGNTQLTHGK